ncbi:MAG TPA: DUF1028 domain-containing protein [Steroidobacteraceae bacterium]|nr:DUF1028 domain-containing protein [Steroidobacteraceae bacterium]
MTFSIVARSSDAHVFGVALASSSPAVAARCAHARGGIGAVATQSLTDPALGTLMLDALGRGAGAGAALDLALRATPFAAYRQLIAIGRDGPPAAHTGALAPGTRATALGSHAAAAGNLLANPGVPAAMTAAFERAGAPRASESQTRAFGERLIAALHAGAAAGGEAGPVHSAGLLIARELSWPIVDLRIDWSEEAPLQQLSALWERYAPQIEDYVRRAIDPGSAPRFGVPGDCGPG